jgi:hypothetical protein
MLIFWEVLLQGELVKCFSSSTIKLLLKYRNWQSLSSCSDSLFSCIASVALYKSRLELGARAHAYNPSYSGGRDQEH